MKKIAIFVIIAGFCSLLYVVLISQNRIPIAHDTFQYLQSQYIYYNEVVQHQAIPIWFPFTNMGGIGNFHFTAQVNILSPVFYLLGLFFDKVDYLYLFYGLIWFEEMFFILGVILIASLYYQDARTIFFVTLTMLGTNIWYPQIWWNFHLYYFIPIVLYCLHMWLRGGYFRYLIYSIIFFALSVLGNFIYCIVFTSFVVIIYISFLILSDLSSLAKIRSALKNQFTLKNMSILFLLLFMMGLSFSYIIYGSSEIDYIGQARTISGSNSLETFLNYGGSIGPNKYKEIFTKYGDSVDINLYGGFLLVPFIMISLLYVRKKTSIVVGGVAFIIFLFSIGIIVPYLFYYLYPLGKIFRHIGLTATMCKFFTILYAGFGFDYFLTHTPTRRILSLVILAYLIVLFGLSSNLAIDTKYFWLISREETSLFLIMYISLFLSIIIFTLMYITKIQKRYLIFILFLLLCLDFFPYKYSLIVTRMPIVNSSVMELFKPYAYKFSKQRLYNRIMQADTNKRLALFLSIGFRQPKNTTWYDTMESFFYTDVVISRFRIDFMLKAISDYFSIASRFPNNTHKVYLKYAGYFYPKLAAFSTLHVVDNELVMGQIFTNKDFTGDMLFTSSHDIQNIRDHIPAKLIRPENQQVVNHNDRIPAEIQVKQFSFNTLKLDVNVEGPVNESCLLYYADGYHPDWKAYINGTITPVIRSNIGFKAVVIPYGKSEVTLHFGNWFYVLSMGCTMVLLLITLGLAIILFKTEMMKSECQI